MYVETHTSSCTPALSDFNLLVDQSLTLNLVCSQIRGNRNKSQMKNRWEMQTHPAVPKDTSKSHDLGKPVPELPASTVVSNMGLSIIQNQGRWMHILASW